MVQAETRVLQEVDLEAGKRGHTLFRNDTGAYKAPNGQWIQYGLHKGSSDLIGWTSIEITPDMVGKKVAIFTAFEVKTKTGKASNEQIKFLNRVEKDGGIAKLVRGKEDLDDVCW